ncbi:MAG: NADH:ubiquinone oxidoreductase [Actinomycetota bacterium]|jgi:Ni,Fe-hydrogenase III small subunit|nr:NADH:ubiquinone oxidoreductase [Actinomycetota bacterium]
MTWIFKGLSNGVVTSKYPKKADGYGHKWQGSLMVSRGATANQDRIEQDCPTHAIGFESGQARIDIGMCIFCGRCVEKYGDTFSFTPEFETARLTRELLVVPELSEDETDLASVKAALAIRMKAFGNSVVLRHVDCGSDGSEEWEIAALTNPIYDVQRLGITFTASPRHADILIVTGAGSLGMVDSLKETYLQMPNPKAVIAVGTDAISGGVYSSSPQTVKNGINEVLPVDIYVPGSPPSPFGILYGILLALRVVSDRNEPR